jgi:ABC-type amino acid transport system permease subunit
LETAYLNVSIFAKKFFKINLSSNHLNNLRPIWILNSISIVLAHIFERLLGYRLNEIKKTHQNQFGYKSRTSCTRALFIFKETIIKHLDVNKSITVKPLISS